MKVSLQSERVTVTEITISTAGEFGFTRLYELLSAHQMPPNFGSLSEPFNKPETCDYDLVFQGTQLAGGSQVVSESYRYSG